MVSDRFLYNITQHNSPAKTVFDVPMKATYNYPTTGAGHVKDGMGIRL